MINYVLPTTYVAGTVLLIADQYRELTKLRKKLLPQFFYRLFDEPKQAEAFLLKQYCPHVYKQAWLSKSQEQENGLPQQVQFSPEKLLTELNSTHRFEEVVVVVIDTAIHSLSTMAFCQKINFLGCKKILLIAPDELDSAKQTVAQGIIDGYVVKDHKPSMYLKLTTAISTLAYNYFQQASRCIVQTLQTQLPCLADMAFIDFFQTLCFEYEIVEFYLTSLKGNYLLLDKQAKPHYLEVAMQEMPSNWSTKTLRIVYGKQTYYCRLLDEVNTLPHLLPTQACEPFSAFCARAAEYL